jgi:predicted MFS family arabinose efflux permease
LPPWRRAADNPALQQEERPDPHHGDHDVVGSSGSPRCTAVSPSQALTLPTNHARWWILALLFVCRTGLGLQFQALGSVSDPLVSALGFSYVEIGTLIGLFMLPGLVLALPAGYMGRYLSDRVLVGLALSCLAAGGVIASMAQGFGALALGRIAAGAGFVISTIYLTKMTADWFAGNQLATAMGILVMSWPLGVAIGQIGHVWLALHFDWRAAFLAASLYCALSGLALFLLYRPPAALKPAPAGPMGLPRHELVLTLLAATVWGLFNAGYIVYLSFAPRVLEAGGYGPTQAAAVISLASWVMILSGPIGGRLADRSGRGSLILYVCMAGAIVSLLLLQHSGMAVALSLAFGLFGGAPAGVIMALTGEAMAPQRRAFGMGVFFSFYFVLMTLGPPIAGWLFDLSGDPFRPIQFAIVLFALSVATYHLFQLAKVRMARS